MIIRKIVLLGEVGVGKTSISRRVVFGTFGDVYAATIGVDVYQYELVPSPVDQPFQLLLWDTDGSFGEDIFRQVYARSAQAALLVCDVSRPATIETMFQLGKRFEEAAPGRFYAHVVNKMDLAEPAAMPPLVERLERAKVPYQLTSAKDGRDVTETFARAAREIMKLEGRCA